MQPPFVGQVNLFAFNFAPMGWAPCAGQLLPISQNTALFTLLNIAYGGDGNTTFGLPDYRSLAPEGMQYCIALQGIYPRQPQADVGAPLAGEVVMLPYQFSPAGWGNCDGTLLPVSGFGALFQVLGTRFGGDGKTTFGLPNLTKTPPPPSPMAGDGTSLYFISEFGIGSAPSAFLATVQLLPFASTPVGWSTCEGQLLPIAQNQALFSLLGTTFGGDGVTTFGLPDLRNISVPADTQYFICVAAQPPMSGQEQGEAAAGDVSTQGETGSPEDEAAS